MVDKYLGSLVLRLGITLYVCVNDSTGNVISITTRTADYSHILTKLSDYGYSVGSSTSITFDVKACHNAYMGLLKQDSDHQLLYYFGIGTMANEKTVLKIGSTSSTSVSIYTSPLLDCANFVKFEARWNSGKVQLWTTISGVWTKIIDHADSNTIYVKYIGITTAVYTDGDWRIYSGTNGETTVETSTIPASSPFTTSTALSTTSTVFESETTVDTSTTPASSPVTTSTALSTASTTFETSSQHEISTAHSTTTSTGWCRMVCHVNYTSQELAEQIKQLKTELQVDKKSTSRHLNTLISAGDDRQSAAYIGYFGASFLACIFGCVVLVDLPNLKNMVQKMRRNISSVFQ